MLVFRDRRTPGTGRRAVPAMAAGLMAWAFLSGIALAGDGTLSVRNAWVRPTPPGVTLTAFYAEIFNSGSSADRLVGGSSPMAATLEVHAAQMQGGMMRMQPLPGGLQVPAGGTATLSPGGLHIMLIGLRGRLAPGETVPVTLHFEHAGSLMVTAQVREVAPGTGMPSHSGNAMHMQQPPASALPMPHEGGDAMPMPHGGGHQGAGADASKSGQ